MQQRNSPFILGLRAITYAIAAGNTCVLKGSELSPRCFWAIASILKSAGLPDGVVNFIFTRPQDAPEVTSAIIEHPFVKKINYTGSTAIGSIISAQAGKHLKPVLMELGGKAPAIVLKDANLQTAAEGCASGSFLHSGQICMSTERILVHSSIAEPFRQALKAAMDKLYGAKSPAPILVTAPPVQKNKKLVEQALSKGAKILAGDLNAKESSDTRMRPILIDGVTKDMDIYQTESFGPTVSLIVVDSEEEAVEIANDTEYGLSSAVFTQDLTAGLRVAKQIETGYGKSPLSSSLINSLWFHSGRSRKLTMTHPQGRPHQQQHRARRTQPPARRGQEERLGPLQRHGGHRGVPPDQVRHLVRLKSFRNAIFIFLHLCISTALGFVIYDIFNAV